MKNILDYMKNVTFNQIAAFSVSVLCIVILTKHKFVAGDASQDAIKGALGLAVFYLFGSTSGSHAKDLANKDILDNAITGLANSTTNQINQVTKNS